MALNNLKRVDMPLNKETKPKQTKQTIPSKTVPCKRSIDMIVSALLQNFGQHPYNLDPDKKKRARKIDKQHNMTIKRKVLWSLTELIQVITYYQNIHIYL